jgi:predicted AAA+ superfamily ATPase
MYHRFLADRLAAALADTPVVLINGARQTGKTTLVQSIASPNKPMEYITLDDAVALSAARSDPGGFISGINGPAIIDEVQHSPELFSAIKASVDRNRAPGRFLLTGSANVMLLPKLSESLAGRMEILTLWPLSRAEIADSKVNIVDQLFKDGIRQIPLPTVTRSDLIQVLLTGGFPEPLSRPTETRRSAWFNAYVTTILQREVTEIAAIERSSQLPRLLQVLASRTASLLNISDISRAIGVPYATLHRYMSLLQATYLVILLPAWSSNLGLRSVKSPKAYLCDPALICALLGQSSATLARPVNIMGQILESFVAMEVMKAIGVAETRASLFHYRTHSGHEVDLLLEDAGGNLVAIEVKASSTVTVGDFKGIKALEAAVGNRLLRGVVLYTGDSIVSFAENMQAAPLQALWS